MIRIIGAESDTFEEDDEVDDDDELDDDDKLDDDDELDDDDDDKLDDDDDDDELDDDDDDADGVPRSWFNADFKNDPQLSSEASMSTVSSVCETDEYVTVPLPSSNSPLGSKEPPGTLSKPAASIEPVTLASG